MLIKESTFRRIIREEALRVLREQDEPTATPGKSPAWRSVKQALNTLRDTVRTLSRNNTTGWLFNTLDGAVMGWDACQDPNSDTCRRVFSYVDSAPAQSSRDTLASVLLLLAKDTSSKTSGSIFDALTDVGGAIGHANADKVRNAFDNAISAGILRNMREACTAPKAPAAPAAAAPAAVTYTVMKGDTLSALLNRFYGIPVSSKTPYDALAKTIGIKDANLIVTGQVIKFPPTLTVGSKTYNNKGITPKKP